MVLTIPPEPPIKGQPCTPTLYVIARPSEGGRGNLTVPFHTFCPCHCERSEAISPFIPSPTEIAEPAPSASEESPSSLRSSQRHTECEPATNRLLTTTKGAVPAPLHTHCSRPNAGTLHAHGYLPPNPAYHRPPDSKTP